MRKKFTHFIVVFLNKASKGQTKSFVWPDAPIHAVYSPGCVILVDLLAFSRRWRPSGHPCSHGHRHDWRFSVCPSQILLNLFLRGHKWRQYPQFTPCQGMIPNPAGNITTEWKLWKSPNCSCIKTVQNSIVLPLALKCHHAHINVFQNTFHIIMQETTWISHKVDFSIPMLQPTSLWSLLMGNNQTWLVDRAPLFKATMHQTSCSKNLHVT